MNPWFAKAIVLASSVVMIIVRAPYGNRSRGIKVVRSGRGTLETALLTLAWLAFFLPLIWIATPLLGPSYCVAMAVLFALRLGPEERMMLEVFGKDYAAYMERTKRLVPGV